MADEKKVLMYKGHPLMRKDNLIYYGSMADCHIIMLQILDDGRITDSKGNLVDFKNTILIMTSNIGSEFLLDGIGENGEITDEAAKEVQDSLKLHFRPEFINRLDEIIMFKHLSKEHI